MTRPQRALSQPPRPRGAPPEHHDSRAPCRARHRFVADRSAAALAGSFLPHEIAWAILIVVVLGSLVTAPGAALAELLAWLAIAALTVAPILVNRLRPGVAWWRARLFVFLLTMNAAYFRMGAVVAATGRRSHDAQLQAIDRRLFGDVLAVLADRIAHPLLTELLSACYFLLFPYILASCLRWASRVRTVPGVAQRFYAGFFTLYAVGFLGYLLVPARGPWLDLPHAFAAPLGGGWIARMNDAVVRQGTNHVDVFPSLHVAASAYMLFFDLRHDRARFRRWVLPVLGLWLATIYLRYHYGVDVLAGLALAAAALLLAERWPPRARAALFPLA